MALGPRSTSVRCAIHSPSPTQSLAHPAPAVAVFTVSLGGMATVLNTSGSPLSPGDNVEWTFFTEKGTSQGKRQKSGPRRIGVQLCSVSSPRLWPRQTAPGELLDAQTNRG